MKDKISYKEFNDLVHAWYDKTRPMSSKPRPNLISRFYDEYLDGKDFKFL